MKLKEASQEYPLKPASKKKHKVSFHESNLDIGDDEDEEIESSPCRKEAEKL